MQMSSRSPNGGNVENRRRCCRDVWLLLVREKGEALAEQEQQATDVNKAPVTRRAISENQAKEWGRTQAAGTIG